MVTIFTPISGLMSDRFGSRAICAFGVTILPMIIMSGIRAQAKILGIDIQAVRNRPDIIMTGFDNAFKFATIVCVIGLVFTGLAKNEANPKAPRKF